MDAVERLLTLAGPALVAECGPVTAPMIAAYPDLVAFLGRRNGWFGFDGALFVRPLQPAAQHAGILDLTTWNEPELWRSSFADLQPDGLCFAEDVYGGQFVRGQEGVSFFDPETGEHQPLAKDMQGFAKVILADWRFMTGFESLLAWQALHGALPIGCRLVPVVPLVLGGTCDLENLRAEDAVVAMRARGAVARRLREQQDGTPAGPSS